MKSPLLIIALATAGVTLPTLGLTETSAANAAGLMQKTSPYSVAETLDRLEAVLREKGISVFARIDHAAAAQGAGLDLQPMQLLIFGNPKAGTPLMQAVPAMGIELPMKVLAWQGEAGQTFVTWNSADYLVKRHALAETSAKPLAAIAGLLDAALK